MACFRTNKDFFDLYTVSQLYPQFPKDKNYLICGDNTLYLLGGAKGWMCDSSEVTSGHFTEVFGNTDLGLNGSLFL